MKYKPHEYQVFATEYILQHPIAAILLDMGLGKTLITLSAIFDLTLDSVLIRKVLVIVPLRVVRDTWPAEIEKWDHIAGLKYSVAVGSERERKAALMQKVQVHLINRENIEWLVTKSGLSFDYDMVERLPAERLDSADSIRKWNEGEIPIAVIHPASAGHGLNLQAGGYTLVWFSLTWSLELYLQTNARLWRQGQKNTVVIHHIIARGTIDEQVMKALRLKKKTQSALIDAVRTNLKKEAVA